MTMVLYTITCNDGYQGRRFQRGSGHNNVGQEDSPNNQVRRTGNVELIQSSSAMKGVVITLTRNPATHPKKMLGVIPIYYTG